MKFSIPSQSHIYNSFSGKLSFPYADLLGRQITQGEANFFTHSHAYILIALKSCSELEFLLITAFTQMDKCYSLLPLLFLLVAQEAIATY